MIDLEENKQKLAKLKEKINKVKQDNKFVNFILNGKNLAIIILCFFQNIIN